MPQFNIGDRIVYISKDPIRFGKTGTVKANEGTHLIEFDEAIGSHDGNGMCEDMHGWWCGPSALRKIGEYNLEPQPKRREW